MKKVPWGIFSGVCAMLTSVFTIAIVVLIVVSRIMIASVGGDDGLLSNWWVYLLYVLDVVTLAGFAACLVFYIRKGKEEKQGGKS